MTKHKRINLTQIEAFLESAGPEAGGTVVYDLIAELKKMYAREDELLDALRIITLDLDNQPTGPNGDIFEHIKKIRNFANDALLGMSVDKPKCRNCGATTNLHQNRFDKKHDCGACLQELQDMNDFDSQHTL